MTRYTYLDLIRGIAAFVVLIVHYRWFYALAPMDFGTALKVGLPWESLLSPLYLYGGIAVQAFWVLSGVIFMLKYGDQGRTLDISRFWVWRFARLYPLHFATLITMAFIQWISINLIGGPTVYPQNDTYNFILHLFMASDWGFQKAYGFNAPIWSVSVEILIYAVFVVFVVMLRESVITTGAFVAAFLVADIYSKSDIALCGTLFFLGAFTAQILRIVRGKCDKVATVIGLIGLPVAVATIYILSNYMSPSEIRLLIFLSAFPAIMLLALTADAHLRPLPNSVTWIGDLTYSTYLLHMPILITMKLVIDGRPERWEILRSPLMLIGYLGLVLVLSWIVYRRFELPAQRWIQQRYISNRKGGRTAGNSQAR